MRLTNKNVFITGANSGIGRVCALELAKLGANLFLAGKSQDRHENLLKSLRAINPQGKFIYLHLDLADLDSVRSCAKTFLKMDEELHILINNAGVLGLKGVTQQGFEIHFGVNHLGHFLLTNLLLERIKSSASSRIINVASGAHRRVDKWDWASLQKPTRGLFTMGPYSVSKLANILFTKELAIRLQGTDVLTFSLHPGVVNTGIWRNLPKPMQSIKWMPGILNTEDGAKTTMYCVHHATSSQNGAYFSESALSYSSTLSNDASLAKELWVKSASWVGLT
jgi:retinol dehydrogenase 12